MPHGYKCDRCGEFKNKGEARKTPRTMDGLPENVRVADPLKGSSGPSPDVSEFSLCRECRVALVRWVENTEPDDESTSHSPPSPDNDSGA